MIPRLALRTLNDLRRASPLAYISLRYILVASAARKNRWASEAAPELVQRRANGTFLTCYQFKEHGRIRNNFRTIHFPGGTEALAETALLEACAAHPNIFQPIDEVFSYRLAPATSTDGAYQHYYDLFCDRQRAIAKACRQHPDYVVLYTDIKSFYPSITHGRALRLWRKACRGSGIHECWRLLGDRLLANQAAVSHGICVGPRFSHLIANLLLTKVDHELRRRFPNRYFRYVDDIVVVVPKKEIRRALAMIRRPLRKLRLKLNGAKFHTSSSEEWLKHAPVVSPSYDQHADVCDTSWMHFVDHLKCYLMAHPGDYEDLRSRLKLTDFRVPLPRYNAAVRDADYNLRFSRRLRMRGFIETLKSLSVTSLLQEARELRAIYWREFEIAWERYRSTDVRFRKWHLSRVRYLAGRLLFVADATQVMHLIKALSQSVETKEYAAMFRAISNRDASELVSYGGKICAAVGQALAASDEEVKCQPHRWLRERVDGYISLVLVGCRVKATLTQSAKSLFAVQFVGGAAATPWWKMEEGFFRELFALSFKRKVEDHQELLQQPFDPDEEWAVFADELIHGWDS